MFTQKKLRFTLLILVLWLAIAPAAFAQDGDPTPEPGDTVVIVEEAPSEEAAPTQEVGISLDSVLALLIFLLGFFPLLGGSVGTLISTLVDIIKATGLLKDGWAALPLLLFNFVAIIILYVVLGLKPGDAVPAELDATLKQFVEFIAIAMTLAGSLGFGKFFHDKVLSKMAKGFSYSAQAAPKATTVTYSNPQI